MWQMPEVLDKSRIEHSNVNEWSVINWPGFELVGKLAHPDRAMGMDDDIGPKNLL
jgi:hypothetical protein